MKAKDITRILLQNGFVLLRSNGHLIYGKEGKTVAVPNKREIKSGTSHGILKRAGLV